MLISQNSQSDSSGIYAQGGGIGARAAVDGHLERLRHRFMLGGHASMPDYEVLELVLSRSMGARDVKLLAHALFEAFGDLNRIVTAPPARLREVNGMAEETIIDLKILEAAAHRLVRSRVMKQPVLSRWDALLDYCHISQAHLPIEQFRVLYLDCKNVLIADEEQAKGTVDHVPVYPREVVKRALELHASALILVHNHPSGDPTPSRLDIDVTQKIQAACEVLGLTLHDHIIIGRSQELSMRTQGFIS